MGGTFTSLTRGCLDHAANVAAIDTAPIAAKNRARLAAEAYGISGTYANNLARARRNGFAWEDELLSTALPSARP